MKTEQDIGLLSDSGGEDLSMSQITEFSLLNQQSRCDFLFTLYWFGEQALFPAVSHVWNRLADPRELRCTQMGMMSGTGGKGKTALLLTLQRFLCSALEIDNPLPERADFEALDDWHAAAMGAFAADKADVEALCQAYALILDGGSVDDPRTRTWE